MKSKGRFNSFGFSVLIVLVSVAVSGRTTFAADAGHRIDVHPWVKVPALGTGFDIARSLLGQRRSPCVQGEEKRVAPSAKNIEFRIAVHNRVFSLYYRLGLSGHLAGRLGLPKPHQNHDELLQVEKGFLSDSLVWTVRASKKGQSVRLTDVRLTPAKEALLKKSPTEFWAQCGSHYVEEKETEGSVAWVFHIHELPTPMKQELKTKVRQSFGNGPDYSVNEEAWKSILMAGSVAVQRIETIEGKISVSRSGLISNLDDVAGLNIKKVIGDSIKRRSPVSFKAVSYEKLGYTDTESMLCGKTPLGRRINLRVRAAFQNYRRYSAMLDRLNKIIREKPYNSSSRLSEFKSLRRKVHDVLVEIGAHWAASTNKLLDLESNPTLEESRLLCSKAYWGSDKNSPIRRIPPPRWPRPTPKVSVSLWTGVCAEPEPGFPPASDKMLRGMPGQGLRSLPKPSLLQARRQVEDIVSRKNVNLTKLKESLKGEKRSEYWTVVDGLVKRTIDFGFPVAGDRKGPFFKPYAGKAFSDIARSGSDKVFSGRGHVNPITKRVSNWQRLLTSDVLAYLRYDNSPNLQAYLVRYFKQSIPNASNIQLSAQSFTELPVVRWLLPNGKGSLKNHRQIAIPCLRMKDLLHNKFEVWTYKNKSKLVGRQVVSLAKQDAIPKWYKKAIPEIDCYYTAGPFPTAKCKVVEKLFIPESKIQPKKQKEDEKTADKNKKDGSRFGPTGPQRARWSGGGGGGGSSCKTISIWIGFRPGGTASIYASTFADRFAAHIACPPKITFQHMPGAGGTKVLNYTANVAPKDGTSIVLMPANAVLRQSLLPRGIKYDVRKFGWIGRISASNSVILVLSDTGIKNLDHLRRSPTFGSDEIHVPASGWSSNASLVPRLMNTMFGTKFKVITGYRGMSKMLVALETNEVKGVVIGWGALLRNKPHWIANNSFRSRKPFVRPIFQLGMEPENDLKNVPLIRQLAKNDRDRTLIDHLGLPSEIGQSIALPPGAPKKQLAVLRAAFDRTVRDPAFLRDARERRLLIKPKSGSAINSVIEKAFAISRDKVQRLRKMLGLNNRKRKIH